MSSIGPVVWDCTHCNAKFNPENTLCGRCYAWVCFACSFINGPENHKCQVCCGKKYDHQKIEFIAHETEKKPPLPEKRRHRNTNFLDVPENHQRANTPSPTRSRLTANDDSGRRPRSASPRPRENYSADNERHEKHHRERRKENRRASPEDGGKNHENRDPFSPKPTIESEIGRTKSRFEKYEREKIVVPRRKTPVDESKRKIPQESNEMEQGKDTEGKPSEPVHARRGRNHFSRQIVKKRFSKNDDILEDEETDNVPPKSTPKKEVKGTPARSKSPFIQDQEVESAGKRRSKIELDDYGWNCKLCTYLNTADMLKCEMCMTRKPDLSMRSMKQRLTRKRHLKMGNKSIKIKDREKKEEKDAMTKWIQIVNFCKEHDMSFVDDSFKPCDESLFGSRGCHHGNPIQWLRCHDIRSGNHSEDEQTWSVMKSTPLPEDIEQGELGNCWFLSALAVLAERKDLLEKIVLTKTFCEQGVYLVRLCKDGRWKVVVIDDFFPCTQHKTFKYSRARRKQLWVPIIEKAAAKLHGSYAALTSGRSTEALALLTGQPCEKVDLQESQNGKKTLDMDVVWSQLVMYRDARFLMGAPCGQDRGTDEKQYEKMGLVPNHAYSLMDVQEIQGNRLVKLRNPWGKTSWKGPWCDWSSKWNSISDSNKRGLQLDGNDKGIFWMELDDFRRYYSAVDVCKARKDWHELRVKGTFPPHAKLPWKFVTFTTLNKCELNLGLFQKSFRGEGKSMEPFVDLLIVVLENHTEENPMLYKKVVATSRRGARCFTGCDVVLRPGMYTVACLAFKHWKTDCQFVTDDDLDQLNKDFVLSIHSSDMIISDEIDTMHPRYKYAIADTLIQLALNKGKRNECRDGLVIYDLFWYGIISVVENRSTSKYAHIRTDCSAGSYQLPTRGNLLTIDTIPPRHRQVVVVLTPFDAAAGWSSSKQISYLSTDNKDLSNFDHPGKQHVPKIPAELEGLHIPRPM